MAAGVGLALAFMSAGAGAGAAGQATTAGRCANETVAVFGNPTTLRFVLYGVSCREAHSLIRTYFRSATTQTCRNHGTICLLEFPGHWDCGFIFAGEGPGFAGCSHTRYERFKVFRVLRQFGSQLHLATFLSPDRKILCLLFDNHKPHGVRSAFCAYNTLSHHPGQEYSATLRPDGRLATCTWHPGQDPNGACYQIWGSGPVLPRGKVDALYQYRCQASSTTVTCTVDTGKGKGHGFTISDAGVTPIA